MKHKMLLLSSVTTILLASLAIAVTFAATSHEIPSEEPKERHRALQSVATAATEARTAEGIESRANATADDASDPPLELHPEQHTLHDEKEASGGDGVVSFHYWIMTLGLMVVVLSHDIVHRLRLTSRLSESGAVILLGVVFGWLVMVTDRLLGDPKDSLLDAIKFDHSFFVRFALPVIIFEQGYSMHHAGVVENLEVVLLLAIPGVVASGVMIGTIVYLLSPFTFPTVIETSGGFFLCLALGALLSATDPVAVVSILKSKFDITVRPPTIYNVIFGESMLNDAVSIVLFEVALDYVHVPVTAGGLAHAASHFLSVLFGSAFIGYVHGVGGVMVLKGVTFQSAPHMEIVLTVLFAGASYYLCEFLDLSGIMSLFVAARMLGHHAPKHMSAEAAAHAPILFRTMASLAECACFFLLGAAFFSYPHTWGITFFVVTIVACLASRAVVVYWCSTYGNLGKRHKLTRAAQVFVWYSGMRGAVSFGLAAVLLDHCGLIGVHDDVATLMLSTTLAVITFTVIALGGGASTLLEYLELQHESRAIETTLDPIDNEIDIHTSDDTPPPETPASTSTTPGNSSSILSPSRRAAHRARAAAHRMIKVWAPSAAHTIIHWHGLFVAPLLEK
ncbi:sodium/hydrogen antiporter, putative [Bodo saltans]|uniref:Sodium/hydrogen antiporter, putative n=1 Tax=Bodo saltans TaxID=75058 RepID=B6DTI7_BODSA|nr:solute carrier family protein [Bodo saltans]CUE73326.1 sodium/hydrogen antiporter, putative [Bodo saltans]|eukprot:CUE73326.1 sodium/hydrogen antiporter, putative [Bodo saltans]